uniref:SID1 transmembrane family member 1 n=1 Tax=Macrostomum lignano TaxID=282301 RepID=A0A1I8FBA7_9PLAT
MAARHLLLLLLLEAANAASTAETASFGRVYRSSVGAGVERVFAFTYATPDDCSTGGAQRGVSVESDEADSEFPLLVVARQQREVISWRLPMSGSTPASAWCPAPCARSTGGQPHRLRGGDVAEAAADPLQLERDAGPPTSGWAWTPRSKWSASEVRLPNVTSVQVRVQSNDALCMRLAVQAAACPANDLARNVEFSGVRQTASRKAVLSIARRPSRRTPDRFNVVLLVYPNDANCRGGVEAEVEAASPSASPPAGSGTRQQGRVKRLTLHVQASLHSEQYGWPVLWTLLFYVLCYLLALALSTLSHLASSRKLREPPPPPPLPPPVLPSQSDSPLPPPSPQRARRRCSSWQESRPDGCGRSTGCTAGTSSSSPIFYCLPVVQLVLTYQRVLNTSGDEDICFYNFECSHPLGPISSFNSVFSNISYGLLGCCSCCSSGAAISFSDAGRRGPPLGLPQHHGLHYAMGVALIMQGVMSACYHVCPSYSNFQFDTAFMYMLCGLCALCLYQARHPDSNAPAHAAYLALAIVILTGLLGVFYGGGSVAFYALFCGLLTGASLLLSLRCVGWARRPPRAALLAVANAANLGLGLYGALAAPRDFGSFLLWVLTANSLAYFLYYLVMKLRSGERLAKAPLAYLALAGVAWAGAGRFYLQQPANWRTARPDRGCATRPACWRLSTMARRLHFLSSAAVFFGHGALTVTSGRRPCGGTASGSMPQQQPGRQPKANWKKMTGNAQLEKAGNQMVRAAKMIEQRLDNEIERLENLNEDDLERLRERRLRQLKEQAKQRDEWLANGHGSLAELTQERDFFDESMRSKRLVCHFYRDTTFRCGIVDRHLTALAPRHIECKFVRISVEKAPFLTRRLGVRVIPTLCIVKDEKVKDYIVGFDDLGGHDNFSTEMLEWRLARSEVIDYRGDLETPPDSAAGRRSWRGKGGKRAAKAAKEASSKKPSGKTIRGDKADDDSDDDEDDW